MAPPVKPNKTISKSSMAPVHGGSAHMFGKSGATPARPEAMVTHGSGGGNWAKGGSGHMVGKQSARPSKKL